jgi:predicted phage-related endonuclease
MSNKSKKGFNGTPQARERRTRVVTSLENQLRKNIKPALVTTENGSAIWTTVQLEQNDTERIKKELSILKNRI